MANQVNAIDMGINLVVTVVIIVIQCANVFHFTLIVHVLTTDKFTDVSFFLCSRMIIPDGSRGTLKKMIEVQSKAQNRGH